METKKYTPEEEDRMINKAFQEMLSGYLQSNHRKKVEIIERAFKFAREAHKGVRRRSGEPYILHPIAVARIVSHEIGLGSTSICAALLHDVVEDTDYTVEDIESQFGKKIAQIVDGLTKISGGIFGDRASAQAENFRKLLLTMNNDIRVILIKMADRLHNMRTLGSMLPSKQYKIAGETLYIYAPLAHRLGLFAIKTELEDLSFKYEHPEIYKQINEKIAATAEHRNSVYEKFAAPVRERLDAMGLKYDMTARVKSAYSIWNKMESKHIPFEEVYDLYAARIVFQCDNEADEKKLCWNIYSEITDLYRLHPDRTRDWLSTPKANGYRALHLTVMGPDGNWIEVQIRSEKMNEMAERGFAAHWKYKIGEGEEESELASWLKTIQDILENPEPNALDFLDTIKLNLFSSEIVIFTPKGELITLPVGATVLDVAFSLHSEIGTHCIAGKVNHKLVPLSQKLQSGDQVEVLTSNSQQPQPEWINFLATAKGKTRLRAALRRDRRAVIERGEKEFADFLQQNGLEPDNVAITKVLSMEHLQHRDDLFFMIGCNEIALSDSMISRLKGKPQASQGGLFSKILRNPFAAKPKAPVEEETITTIDDNIDKKKTYVLTTENGVSNYMIAPCCHPIPGDDVVGYIDDDRHVVVHKLTCPNAMRLKSSFGGRLLSTKWDNRTEKFLASIHIEGIDRMGILQELIYIISTNMAINIRGLNIAANEGVFSCELTVLVEDTNVVTALCKQVKKVKGVNSAARMN
ncbi:MAG: RelA/SpoT family protein [Bacteroidales bacterium]|nr:RelA/SpoT family protein [Bacteroidales bacterium]